MRICHFALGVALLLAIPAESIAAGKENWVGAWGFSPIPPPPGVAMPVTPPAIVPLAPLPEAAAIQPPLVENPGNVPIATLLSDPADVTIRQLVRVSAAGKRIRLRFTNEGGSEVLNLAAVHVGLAGPDGSVLRATQTERIRDEMIVQDLDPALLAGPRGHPNYTLRNRRPELFGELVLNQVSC